MSTNDTNTLYNFVSVVPDLIITGTFKSEHSNPWILKYARKLKVITTKGDLDYIHENIKHYSFQITIIIDVVSRIFIKCFNFNFKENPYHHRLYMSYAKVRPQ